MSTEHAALSPNGDDEFSCSIFEPIHDSEPSTQPAETVPSCEYIELALSDQLLYELGGGRY